MQKYDLLDVATEYAKRVKGRCDFDKDGNPVEKLVQKKFDTQVIQRDRLVAALLEEVESNYADSVTVEHGVAVNSCTFSESGDKATLEIFECKEDGDYLRHEGEGDDRNVVGYWRGRKRRETRERGDSSDG